MHLANITGFRSPVAPLAAAICLGLAGAAAPASAAGQGSAAARGSIDFDIPAEPLGDALYAYSAATGIEILAEDGVIAGRRSAVVRGAFAPEAALRRLLAESGLTARRVDAGAITLTPVSTMVAIPAALPAPAALPPTDRYGAYSAALQAAVARALCRYDETRPGYYRLAVRLWIGPSGMVEHLALLGSTGDETRDQALARLLGRLSVADPPPPGLPQPATVLIMPLSPQETGDCAAVKRASAAP